MSDAEGIVRRFCEDWSKTDADLLTDYFTDDGVYHNMPMQPLVGRDAIRAFLAAFLDGVDSAEFRMVNLVSSDDIVMTERVDVFRFGDVEGAFEVMGIFELRDGKIAAWRDYFDMAAVTAFLAAQNPRS